MQITDRLRALWRANRVRSDDAHNPPLPAADPNPTDLAVEYTGRWDLLRRQMVTGGMMFCALILCRLMFSVQAETNSPGAPRQPQLVVAMDPTTAAAILAAIGAFTIAVHLRLITLGGPEPGDDGRNSAAAVEFFGVILEMSAMLSILVGLAAVMSGAPKAFKLEGLLVLVASTGPAVLSADVLSASSITSARERTRRAVLEQRRNRLGEAAELWGEPGRQTRRPWGLEYAFAVALPVTLATVGGRTGGISGLRTVATIGGSLLLALVAFLAVRACGVALATGDWFTLASAGFASTAIAVLVLFVGFWELLQPSGQRWLYVAQILSNLAPLAVAGFSVAGRLVRSGAVRTSVARSIRSQYDRMSSIGEGPDSTPDHSSRLIAFLRHWSGRDADGSEGATREIANGEPVPREPWT